MDNDDAARLVIPPAMLEYVDGLLLLLLLVLVVLDVDSNDDDDDDDCCRALPNSPLQREEEEDEDVSDAGVVVVVDDCGNVKDEEDMYGVSLFLSVMVFAVVPLHSDDDDNCGCDCIVESVMAPLL